MQPQQAGITALISAYARAYHVTHDDPLIFNDSLAPDWFTPQELAFFEKNVSSLAAAVGHPQANPAEALRWVMQHLNGPITLARSQYTEAALAQSVCRQYVLLGAGFDTYAFRQPAQGQAMQIFEVDHPATQAMKRERLARMGWPMPANLHWVALDFSKDDLHAALLQAGLDRAQPVFFAWLGVSFYLDRADALATLRAAAGFAPGSQLVFDYSEAAAFDPQRAHPLARAMQAVVARSGEPMHTGFEPSALPGELAALGLTLLADLGPEEIQARYFANANGYRAFPHAHIVQAKVADALAPDARQIA
jgi:methyltransferase (TIGR00027 family)